MITKKILPFTKISIETKKTFQIAWQGWHKTGRVTLFSLWSLSEVTKQKHTQMQRAVIQGTTQMLVWSRCS